MLVPVSFVRGVQMPVVQIVDVVAVGDGSVAATRTVLMGMLGVFHAVLGDAFVPVVTMFVVAMAVVHVIDMVTVSNGHVTAVGPVHVRVIVLGRVILVGMPMRVGNGHAPVSHTKPSR